MMCEGARGQGQRRVGYKAGRLLGKEGEHLGRRGRTEDGSGLEERDRRLIVIDEVTDYKSWEKADESGSSRDHASPRDRRGIPHFALCPRPRRSRTMTRRWRCAPTWLIAGDRGLREGSDGGQRRSGVGIKNVPAR